MIFIIITSFKTKKKTLDTGGTDTNTFTKIKIMVSTQNYVKFPELYITTDPRQTNDEAVLPTLSTAEIPKQDLFLRDIPRKRQRLALHIIRD